jgi:hypothetical protein
MTGNTSAIANIIIPGPGGADTMRGNDVECMRPGFECKDFDL